MKNHYFFTTPNPNYGKSTYCWEMDNLFKEEGMEVQPGYEEVLKDLLAQLTKLRKDYKDNTEKPVKFWPRNSHN